MEIDLLIEKEEKIIKEMAKSLREALSTFKNIDLKIREE